MTETISPTPRRERPEPPRETPLQRQGESAPKTLDPAVLGDHIDALYRAAGPHRQPCFHSSTSTWAAVTRDAECAGTAQGGCPELAAAQLTIWSKRNSSALGPGFPSVAHRAVLAQLPLWVTPKPKET